ncbi:MAG: multicopper oxidase domain-containing protein [Crocinitomicaceae bacterium]|nr:multicopper oxidase domain-containing protein [Crocinitomicaceae bacterium]
MRYVLVTILTLSLTNGVAQIDASELLIARNTGTKTLADGNAIPVMGFAQTIMENPAIPGPTLEFYEGDSVEIDLWNFSQGAPHTVHLHGLDVDQQNDGVPHLSFEVYHMDHGFYYFKAPHAGTYLYHCHVVSSVHVQAGMYGLLIVHPSDGSQTTWNGGYDYDNSMSLLMSEIDTTWHSDSVMLHTYDTSLMVNYVAVPEYKPQFYLVNGLSDQQIADSSMQLNTSAGAVNYLRLANIGFKGCRVILPSTFGTQIIDSDGRPFPNIEYSDTVLIFPGERYGVLGTLNYEGNENITIEYFDMNTGILENTQYVPIVSSGFVGLNSSNNSNGLLTVQPNPFNQNTTLHIQSENMNEVIINIFDIRGQLVLSEKLTDNIGDELLYEIDGTLLHSGIYLAEVLIDQKERLSQKIIRY